MSLTQLSGRLALAAGILGCTRTLQPPDLGQLYDRMAMAHHDQRNPVVLIHGILGARLVQEGSNRVVWGAFTGDYADPTEPSGARLVALPMRAGAPLSELTDDVVEDGALETIEVQPLGLPISVAAYINILLALGAGGYRDESLADVIDYGDDHFTCFQFSYDWRRDLSETAARLDAFLEEKSAHVRRKWKEYGIERDEVRFDVVAHSMGGLLLRYYLRYGGQPLADDGPPPELDWRGAARIERAILVGTPNAGSCQSLHELVDGTKLGPFLPRYPPAVVSTMPAAYQLLPRARHDFLLDRAGNPVTDPLDPALWERERWGLVDPDQDRVLSWLLPDLDPAERRRVARDHLVKCLRRARAFHAAIDVPARPPATTELMLVAGDSLPTLTRMRLSDSPYEKVANVEHGPGDGTVPRSSALMDERVTGEWSPVLRSPIHWSRVMFFFRDHLGLTQDPAFIDNLLYILLEEPRTAGASLAARP